MARHGVFFLATAHSRHPSRVRRGFTSGVLNLIPILTLALVGAGCQSTPSNRSEATAGSGSKRAPDPITVRGLDVSVGRIESIRAELRLVVLDYSLSTLPQLGDMLVVSREGNEVGRVKVTGPFRAGTGKLGGEIVSGDLQVGDVVRTQSR